jgi:Domain of unknown function (DUF4440)
MTQTTAASTSASTWEREIRDLEEEARVDFSPGRYRHPDSPVGGWLHRHECEIEHISRHDDVVVVMGHDRVTGPPDGSVTRRRYTNVWQVQDGRWRTIARHAQVVSRELRP